MTRITQVYVLLVLFSSANDPILSNTDIYGIKGQKSNPYHDRPPNLTPYNATMTSEN